MLSLPLYYIVEEVVMEQWSKIQDLLTNDGKLPMSVEVTFGMQKISKMPDAEQMNIASKLYTLCDCIEKSNGLFTYAGNVSNNVLLPVIVHIGQSNRSSELVWYELLFEQYSTDFQNISPLCAFQTYIAAVFNNPEFPLLYDAYLALGAESYMMRMMTAYANFDYAQYLAAEQSKRYKFSIAGLLRNNQIQEAFDFNDPYIEAEQRAIMAAKEYPNTDVSAHVEFFFRHNDIKYLKANMAIKVVNANASQLLLTLPDGNRELYLVTSNNHQVKLDRVSPAIAWCVAYAPAAFKDKPIKDVLEYMTPVYKSKFNKELS